ncbi:MAG: DUF393 domain-containing protein [Alphaproteobacteria bacterium]|jgi:predicted DCC family thiol-disulfide oxidoreductase YuxK|nr:DUF393 domain-containing protein [Alphaproteobacteria bacterium]
MSNVPTASAFTVYFDGACPLCRREIALYQNRRGADEIAWVDVLQATEDDLGGLTRDQALKRFHVRQKDGRLRSGAAAFAALWKALPAFRPAGYILAAPPFVWLAEGLYRLYLPVRPGVQRLMGAPAECRPCHGDTEETTRP